MTSPVQEPASRKPWYRRWWGIVGIALVVIVIIGSLAGGEDDPSATTLAEAADTTTSEADATTQSEVDTTTSQATTTTQLTTTTPPTATMVGEAGVYQVGDYRMADVQVSEDFAGDFEATVRATNEGPAREGVSFTMTLLSGGSVVGTLSGTVGNEWPTDETRTVQFISLDDYTEWDQVEFQVDFEF